MNFIKGDFIDQTVNDFPNVDNDFILLKEEDQKILFFNRNLKDLELIMALFKICFLIHTYILYNEKLELKKHLVPKLLLKL